MPCVTDHASAPHNARDEVRRRTRGDPEHGIGYGGSRASSPFGVTSIPLLYRPRPLRRLTADNLLLG